MPVPSKTMSLHLRTPVALLLAGFALAAPSGANGAAEGSHSEASRPPATEIARQLEAPGAIIAIRYAGSTSHAAAGLADLKSRRSMEPEMPYYLGSISKIYTATIVLQMVDEGLLALDQPLSALLPEFPGGDAIRLRNLLDHTSGLADLAVWAYFRPDRDAMIRAVTRRWTKTELVERIAALEPDFAPGKRWAYSNSNYILLAAVVEAASERSFAAELRGRIFEPLGLERTWLDQYEPPRGELAATGYLGPLRFWAHSEMFGELGPTTILDRGTMEWGAGGIVSTATESITFLEAVMAGNLLSHDSLAAMRHWIHTPPLGAPGPETPPDRASGYGLGLALMVRDGYRMIGHGGLYNGHTAGLWWVPECETTFAYYLNRGFADGRWTMDRLVASLGGQCAMQQTSSTGEER